jgi:hypothetical protein
MTKLTAQTVDPQVLTIAPDAQVDTPSRLVSFVQAHVLPDG